MDIDSDVDVQRAVIEAVEKEFSRLMESLTGSGSEVDFYYGPGTTVDEMDLSYRICKSLALQKFLEAYSVVLDTERQVLRSLGDRVFSYDLGKAFHACPMCGRWYPLEWFSEAYCRNKSGASGKMCLKCEKVSVLTEEPWDPADIEIVSEEDV